MYCNILASHANTLEYVNIISTSNEKKEKERELKQSYTLRNMLCSASLTTTAQLT